MEILCAKFIRMDDESIFYKELMDSPAPVNASDRMIKAGMYYNVKEETVIYDGSFWLTSNDPRIVSE